MIKATLTILAQQWGSTLALPFFLLDRDGNLVFYNEPAELVLGRRFDDQRDAGPRQILQLCVDPQARCGRA